MLKKLIITDKDIVKIVAKRLGEDEIKVKRVLSLSIEYMKHLTDEEGIYTMRLPYVGNLAFNSVAFLRDKHLKERRGESIYTNKERKYVSYRIAEKKHNEIQEIFNKKRQEEKWVIPKHFKRKLLNFKNRGINFIYQLENHQNGWANGHEDYEDGLSPRPEYIKKEKDGKDK